MSSPYEPTISVTCDESNNPPASVAMGFLRFTLSVTMPPRIIASDVLARVIAAAPATSTN